MKKILLLIGFLLLTSGSLFAQSSWPPPIIAASDPAGACANGTFWVNIITPSLWYCGGSVWNAAGGGGGMVYPGLGIALSTGAAWNTSIASPDGDASHFLNGIGGWTAPAGGANVTLSNLTNPTAINDTTLTFAGAGGITAGGTNQNVTLTPSGTGYVGVSAAIEPATSGTSSSVVSITTNGNSANTTLQVGGGSSTGSYTNILGSNSRILMSFASSSAATVKATTTASTLLPLHIISGFARQMQTDVFSATPTFDVGAATIHEMTLTGDVTSFSVSNAVAGSIIIFFWIQDAGGSHTVTAPASFHGFTTPGATGSTYSRQECDYDGTVWLCGVANVNIP